MNFYTARFQNIQPKTYEIEVLTPMFLGGANPEDAELRAPSIKGMLRFWWRAACGIDNITNMKNKEDIIFGSTEIKSSFSMSIVQDREIQPALKLDTYRSKAGTFKVHDHTVSILDYLSYGTYEYKKGSGNEYKKYHIPPESKFKVKFYFHNSQYKDEIIKAFECLVTFGGLGAKSRNGFGSVYCKDINVNPDITAYAKRELRDYTSFSKESKIFKFSEQKSWIKAISEIGMAYHDSRTSIEPHHIYKKRSLISAPLQVNQKNQADDRHSKPYFLKVQKLQNEKFLGIITYIPYNYYNQKQRSDYFAACNEMNQKIEPKLEDNSDDTAKTQ